MENEEEFAERVIGAANRIALMLHMGKADKANDAALVLGEVAARRLRGLRGVPEPDPTIDSDPDCHWDGTERLPGEKRTEKGETDGTLDLATLATLPMDRPE